MIHVIARQGSRFSLFINGTYWIKTHYITEEEMKSIRADIANESSTLLIQQDSNDETITTTDTTSNKYASTSTTMSTSTAAREKTIKKHANKKLSYSEQLALWSKLPPPIIVCNHLSYIDPLIIMAQYGALSIVGKMGVASMFLVGTICKGLGAVFTGHGAVEIIKQRVNKYYEDILQEDQSSGDAKKCLTRVRQLLIYPESTTTIGTSMLQFHKGAFCAGAPVQPVVVKFPFKSFNPAWSGSTLSNLQYMFHISSQISLPIETIHLQPYIPTEAEYSDPRLYAANVRKAMCMAFNMIAKREGWSLMTLSNELFNRDNSRKSASGDETQVTSYGAN